MNRRPYGSRLRNDDAIEHRFRCDGCDWWFVHVEEPGMNISPLESVTGAWCPCRPWDIFNIQIGMTLPQGRVVYLDRATGDVGLDGSGLTPDRIVPFAEVSPPQ